MVGLGASVAEHGRLMVSDDGRESEPMIAFMDRILMKLLSNIYRCMNNRVFESALMFISILVYWAYRV